MPPKKASPSKTRSTSSAAKRAKNTAAAKPTNAAHRQSRRDEILDAAIRLFARNGYVDSSVNAVAEEAGVVATAIYYHFSGKEELFNAAVQRVFEATSGAVSRAREQGLRLEGTIEAVWDWIDANPEEASLFYLQLPGATPQIQTLRQEFEERHVQQAFGYFGASQSSSKASVARRSIEAIQARTLVDYLISIHTMRLADGPISEGDPELIKKTVVATANRLMAVGA